MHIKSPAIQMKRFMYDATVASKNNIGLRYVEIEHKLITILLLQ